MDTLTIENIKINGRIRDEIYNKNSGYFNDLTLGILKLMVGLGMRFTTAAG